MSLAQMIDKLGRGPDYYKTQSRLQKSNTLGSDLNQSTQGKVVSILSGKPNPQIDRQQENVKNQCGSILAFKG